MGRMEAGSGMEVVPSGATWSVDEENCLGFG